MSESGHYAYYPGCSQEAVAKSYDVSTRRVADVLGLTLQEIEDWNCCGASEYFSLNGLPAYSLVARNLALASQQDNTSELTAPCSACFLNLRKTDTAMGKDKKLNQQVNQALAAGGLSYKPGRFRIRHLLDVIVEDVGFEAVEQKVQQKLSGIRLAPYYGCMIARPYSDYNPEYPTHMDDLLKVLGATVVDFPLKTHCCGGHMTQISEDTAYELIRRILQNAADYEADAIVTICPMCQLNLDAYQAQVNRKLGTHFDIPILYFTQMMGLAFGIAAKELGFGSELVSAQTALSKIGQEESPEKRAPKKRDKQALPMPSMK